MEGEELSEVLSADQTKNNSHKEKCCQREHTVYQRVAQSRLYRLQNLGAGKNRHSGDCQHKYKFCDHKQDQQQADAVGGFFQLSFVLIFVILLLCIKLLQNKISFIYLSVQDTVMMKTHLKTVTAHIVTQIFQK